MGSVWQQLGAAAGSCWSSVATQLPQLQATLSQQLGSLGDSLPAWLGGLARGEEVVLGGRRLRVGRQLAEGGYSFVYLAREAPTPERPHVSERPYALKKVLAGSPEQVQEVQHEIAVMQRLQHPNILPLLASAVEQRQLPDGSRRHVALLLFPLCEMGSLWDVVQQRRQARSPLTPAEVLHVFLQVCAALEHMHSLEPPLAHRDVKPHNILLRSKQPESTAAAAAAAVAAGGDTGTSPPLQQTGTPILLGSGASGGGSSGVPAGPAVLGPQCHAVLMDFGSTRSAHREIKSRHEAMVLQEDAERHCTAPYRAPELWDVPSTCTVDERVDVWSLGCVLFFMMCGVSPFEQAVNQAGASLMLAVVNGRFSWPAADADRYPQPLRELVAACLEADHGSRPSVAEVRARGAALQLQLCGGKGGA